MRRKRKCKCAYVPCYILLFCVLLVSSGCGQTEEQEKEVINLSVWCDEACVDLTKQMVEEFQKEHVAEADFQVTISAQSELDCKDVVLANPKGAADIYTFADDQFDALREGGALLEITEDAGEVIAENGGGNNGAILTSQKDGKLYAYPMTAGNAYFLYYNSSYLTREDVKSFDRILEVAGKKGKKVTMDFSSGWYIYSFFKGAGLSVEANAQTGVNDCDWNASDTKYKGIDVAEAMLAIAKHKAFESGSDEEFVEGMKSGDMIAGVNGAWNASEIEGALGGDYAAVKLPTYTLAGDQVQMYSFAGYKLIGINANTRNPQWAMRLARYITNEQNQLKRFELTGECPSNAKAALSEKVQESPAIAALSQQAKYGAVQRVYDTFWTPTNVFGTVIANGNKDQKDLQQLLDNMVEGITAVSQEK